MNRTRPFSLAVSAALVVLPLFLNGCSSTQVYAGPPRPEGELSTVYFHSYKPVDLSAMQIDGVEQKTFDIGMTVLPGGHTFSVDYNFEDRDCTDSYGCFESNYSGSCSGTFESEAGRNYLLDVTSSGSTTYVSAEYIDNREQVGTGDCTVGNSNFGFHQTHR